MPLPLVDLPATLAAAPPAEFDVELGPSDLPLALFPVRLETRFFGDELRVRVYPDKVHLDAHDSTLAEGEVLWGRRFWELQWADAARAPEAWRMLAGRFGVERAAWIARTLTPANLATRPTGAPAFPEPAAAATHFTPRVRLLPNRWIATAYCGGAVLAVATGHAIEPDLAVGPDFEADFDPDAAVDHERPAIDAGMRWMTDFEEAEAKGMALRLTVAAPVVDVLIVTGVADGDRSQAVAAQLEVHRYTDGLSFLASGTPTNNTKLGRTPYQEPDPQFERSFAREWEPSDRLASGGAARAAAAFGMPFERLDDVDDDAAAAAMATALWPATWGYFLTQMVGFDGTGLSLPAIDLARAHALAHVRPGGPLPVLRIGRQPYGVLPVTSLDDWTGDVAPLRDVLARIRDGVFRPATSSVTRVGSSDDPGDDLNDVLALAPLSTAYLVRALMGQHLLQHLRAFLGEDLDAVGFWQRLEQIAGNETDRLGWPRFALSRAAYDRSARRVTAALVGDPSYIAELLAAVDPEPLVATPTATMPVLQVLLRHALLRTFAEAGARVAGTADPAVLRDAELVDLVPGQAPAPTWSRIRDQLTAAGTVAQANDDPALREMRQALGVLAATPVPDLEQHLAATLDVTSHRIDAWITSLATRRLADLRTAKPTGLVVGGYGWVEDLRPATPGAAVVVPDEPDPVVAAADDPGFIHAPSLTQASAAAVLREAHLSHGGQPDSPHAVELTSARARLARQLFDGVRQGQPLGALLGYTFERQLHEAGRDDLIDDFRTIAPLPGAADRRIVVDGLRLARKWSEAPASVMASPDDTMRRILDSLESAVDAAADAVSAEAAFQMLRGNTARAGATLDAIATGETTPPDLSVLRTPRTGIVVTHRLAAFVAATEPQPTGWAPRAGSPRALADPALDSWAGRLLGTATGIKARVVVGGVATDVALSDLGLTPIDLVWATGGAEGIPAEISARLLRAAGVGDGAIDLSRDAGGLGDLVELATRLQRLLAGARPLDAADLQAPHADPDSRLDLNEFRQRVEAAEQSFLKAHEALRAAVQAETGLPEAMEAVAAFGVPGAIPVAGGELAQALALLAETTRRTTPVAAEAAADAPTPRDELIARLRRIFGAGFLALPRFTMANASDVAASLADDALLGTDRLAAYTWLTRMSRIREPLGRLSRAFGEAEVLGRPGLDLKVAQVAHQPGKGWVGGQLEGDIAEGVASLVLQDAPTDLGGSLGGLLVDEWTEIVPRQNETTGIAFQYDPPDASAPQAILLAVPPVIGTPWTVGGLNRVLLETLELARLRGVNPASLGDALHYLPATYLAYNSGDVPDAVSTDLNLLVQ
jgi:hypothetical protein